MSKPKCCWKCKHLIPYNPEEDKCELDGHIFEDKFCLSTMRDKECPLDKNELKGKQDYISRESVLNTIEDMDKALDTDRTVEEYKALLIECIKALPSRDSITEIDNIRTKIEQLPTKTRINWDGCCPDIDYPEIEYVDVSKNQLLRIIDGKKVSIRK